MSVLSELLGAISTGDVTVVDLTVPLTEKTPVLELPEPFGVGLVYYHLDRAIAVTDVRVGRNGAPPTSVSEFAHLGSTSKVDNVNLKLDAWLLPFLNVYALVGTIHNESDTHVEVTLPPLLPGGSPRTFTTTVPTEVLGTTVTRPADVATPVEVLPRFAG